MSWNILRGYFRDAVQTVHPNWSEWRDAYNYENIPAASIDSKFHLEIGPLASEGRNDQSFGDFAEVTLRIHKKTGKDNVDAFDSLLDTAYNIRKECASLNRLASSANIINVVMDNMVTEFIESNDNTLRFTLSFSVAMKFRDIY